VRERVSRDALWVIAGTSATTESGRPQNLSHFKTVAEENQMKNIVCAIEQETKFMNDSEERGSQYGRGYLRALEIVAAFLSLQADEDPKRKPTCPAVDRLRASVELQTELGPFRLQTSAAKAKRAARTKKTSNGGNRANRTSSKPALLRKENQEQNFSINEPLTRQEQEQLRIALGVLRSGTDYADFLNSWLEDYGRQILSPNPPPPLIPELSVMDELLQAIADAPAYVN
jgi:hypothetical protein